MTGLEDLLAGELRLRSAAAAEPGPAAMHAALVAIRKRRRWRAGAVTATFVVGIGLVAGAGWAMVATPPDGDGPASVPSHAPQEPTTTVTSPSASSPAASATPEPDVEPALQRRDGAAPTASIGDQGWADGKTLPAPLATALTSVAGVRAMEPWVWDHVGAGWSLTVVHEGATGADAAGDQRLLLLSPDGEAFQVWDLRDDVRMWVEHWRADSLIVWFQTDIGADTWSSIALDLRSGDRVQAWGDAGAALGHAYIGTLPDGDDLWQLWSTKYAAADLIRVRADATATYATGFDILESPMSAAWTDATSGWSVLAVGGTETPWGAMPVAELTWYRLDHATWQLTAMATPRLGSLTTIAPCNADEVSGDRISVKPTVSSPNSDCVWLDLGGEAEPVPVKPSDTVAVMPRSSERLDATGLGLGEGSPSVSMLDDRGDG